MQNGKSGPPHLGVYCATPPVEKRTDYGASGRQRRGSDRLVPNATSITWKLGDQPSSVNRSQVARVCAPALLDVDCKTVEHMRLANALCRFVELASTN